MADIKAKKRQNWRLLLTYQKLSVEPRKGREKTQLMQLITTEYANPDLSLAMAVTSLGINRTKINEILKMELGVTFTDCLNKLRLTKATLLLLEKESTNVAEIAYSVGYNNASYFNKLFKTEYRCAPENFKRIFGSSVGSDVNQSWSIMPRLIRWIKRHSRRHFHN